MILLLSFVSSAFAAGYCPPQGGVYDICRGKQSVYVVDSSKDLGPTRVQWQFNWLRDNVISATAWDHDQQVAFMSYGTGIEFTTPLSSNRTYACTSLDSLTNAYAQEGSSSVTLYQAFTSVKNDYPGSNVVIFAGSTDPTDINMAAAFVLNNMVNFKITLVNLNQGDFTNFPAKVITVSDLNNPPPGLQTCVILGACGDLDCDPNGTPGTTVQPTNGNEYECRSQMATSWNDIIFVLDGSDGPDTVIDLWELVQTIITGFNVQKSNYLQNDMVTRVGFVGYNSTASMVATLGEWNQDDIQNKYTMPFNAYQAQTSDIYDAFQIAITELQSSRSRQNARKVIVLLATDYNDHGPTAPIELSEQFQRNNGVIIVWDYVANLAHVSNQLKALASPGYFFVSVNNTAADIQQAFLDANCFCPTDMASYTSQNPRNYPTGGCYWTTDTVAKFYPAAYQRCLQEFQAVVAKTDSDAKSKFLAELYNSVTPFWIGLNYTSGGGWRWTDGTPLGSYHPFLNGVTPSGLDGKQCVYVANDQRTWVADSCTGSSHPYQCQLTPCDSTRYC